MSIKIQKIIAAIIFLIPFVLFVVLWNVSSNCSDVGILQFTCPQIFGFDPSALITSASFLNIVLFPACSILGIYLYISSQAAEFKQKQIDSATNIILPSIALESISQVKVSRPKSIWITIINILTIVLLLWFSYLLSVAAIVTLIFAPIIWIFLGAYDVWAVRCIIRSYRNGSLKLAIYPLIFPLLFTVLFVASSITSLETNNQTQKTLEQQVKTYEQTKGYSIIFPSNWSLALYPDTSEFAGVQAQYHPKSALDFLKYPLVSYGNSCEIDIHTLMGGSQPLTLASTTQDSILKNTSTLESDFNITNTTLVGVPSVIIHYHPLNSGDSGDSSGEGFFQTVVHENVGYEIEASCDSAAIYQKNLDEIQNIISSFSFTNSSPLQFVSDAASNKQASSDLILNDVPYVNTLYSYQLYYPQYWGYKGSSYADLTFYNAAKINSSEEVQVVNSSPTNSSEELDDVLESKESDLKTEYPSLQIFSDATPSLQNFPTRTVKGLFNDPINGVEEIEIFMTVKDGNIYEITAIIPDDESLYDYYPVVNASIESFKFITT
jgi:hypothetical protein